MGEMDEMDERAPVAAIREEFEEAWREGNVIETATQVVAGYIAENERLRQQVAAHERLLDRMRDIMRDPDWIAFMANAR